MDYFWHLILILKTNHICGKYGYDICNNWWDSSVIRTTEEHGKVQDVIIDSIGVWIGICFLLLIVKIYKNRHKYIFMKRKDEENAWF